MLHTEHHVPAVSEFHGKNYGRDHGMHKVLVDIPGPGKKGKGSGTREALVVEFI